MKVHPSLLPYAAPVPPGRYADPVRRRAEVGEFLRGVLPSSPAWLDDLRSDDRDIPGRDGEPEVRVRVFRPATPTAPRLPAVLWFHGGGFITGDLETDALISSRYAAELGVVVVHVDYRLAPEAPYPAAVNDGYAALTWLAEHVDEFGVDRDRIVIAGSSAGAGLAAALSLLARDLGGPLPMLQVLVYPVLDDRLLTESVRNRTDVPALTAEMVRDMWSHYLGADAGGQEVTPYAAPARAASLAGLPPAYILTAELDPLRDEGADYARRLELAGVPVTAVDYEGAFHGFLNMDAEISREALHGLFDFVKRALATQKPPLDAEALRERYRRERDKRFRSEGNQQFQGVRGDFAAFDDDPYADPNFTRPPIVDEVDAVVVGAGLGGLVLGAGLKRTGLERVRIVDRAGDFGGTWYWNRYPGAQCDIESSIYFPLLEEVGYMPTMRYAAGAEIREYCQRVARHFGLYDDALFQTAITGARWDEDLGRWVISTDRGDEIRSRFLVLSSGPLSRPKLPRIPGILDFKGRVFHTSRWDYEYTGGDMSGGLAGLADKRVGVIGTGATAVQVVPHVGESAAELYVFQRTPSSISPRYNRPIDPEWYAKLPAGWQRERMENFNLIVMGQRPDVDLVDDSWTYLYKNVSSWKTMKVSEDSPELAMAAAELSDFTMMEEVRQRVSATVRDPATAELLKPYYRLFCKRPCFSDTYLETFNRSSVTLVDTDGSGVERVTENGVVVAGRHYELDCLILATGFEVGTSYTERNGFDLVGRDGIRLSEKWKDGYRTMFGMHSRNFPNCFFTGVLQGALVTNFVNLIVEQLDHLTHVVARAVDANSYVEPTQEGEDAWVAEIRRPWPGAALLADCTPGFYNNEGQIDRPGGWVHEAYGAGSVAFFELLAKWRSEAAYEGLEFRPIPYGASADLRASG